MVTTFNQVVESPESKAMRRMSMENMQVEQIQKLNQAASILEQFATLVLVVVTCTLYSVHTVPDNEDGKPGSGDQDDPGCQSKGEGKRESFQQ